MEYNILKLVNNNKLEKFPRKNNEVNYEEIFGENIKAYLDDKEKNK